jgi:hypothetical protein
MRRGSWQQQNTSSYTRTDSALSCNVIVACCQLPHHNQFPLFRHANVVTTTTMMMMMMMMCSNSGKSRSHTATAAADTAAGGARRWVCVLCCVVLCCVVFCREVLDQFWLTGVVGLGSRATRNKINERPKPLH